MTDEKATVLSLKPCSCGNRGVEINWIDAEGDAEGHELIVYVHCDECGANGPDAVTYSKGDHPLGTAEYAATQLWNQHRSCTLGQALELPQIQLLFQKLQYFRNKLSGDNLDYILDATYLECEQAYNQVIKRDPA
jgi:hypothetical protein